MLVAFDYVQSMLNLIDLFNEAEIKSVSKFCDVAKKLDITDICDGYAELRQVAPQRSERGKSYFGDTYRTGTTNNLKRSNRREEHCAIAMYNASRAGKNFELPDGRNLELIDYQTPLKAQQSDYRVGKVDLFGVVEMTLPAVIELKVEGQNGTMADTPLRALMEGLAYCAIVEKNISAIAAETTSKFGLPLSAATPILMIMAPEKYWEQYLQHPRTGNWLPELNRLTEGLRRRLNLETHMAALKGADFEMGRRGKPPVLHGNCELVSVDQIAGDS
jgi:hypothetical protein